MFIKQWTVQVGVAAMPGREQQADAPQAYLEFMMKKKQDG